MTRPDLSLPPEYRSSRFILGAPWWVWLIVGTLAVFSYSRLAETKCVAAGGDPLGLLTAPQPRP
jgi:hypothetical protein